MGFGCRTSPHLPGRGLAPQTSTGDSAPETRWGLILETSLPAQHLWPSGLFSWRSHSLELSSGFHPGPDQCRLFQTFALIDNNFIKYTTHV